MSHQFRTLLRTVVALVLVLTTALALGACSSDPPAVGPGPGPVPTRDIAGHTVHTALPSDLEPTQLTLAVNTSANAPRGGLDQQTLPLAVRTVEKGGEVVVTSITSRPAELFRGTFSSDAGTAAVVEQDRNAWLGRLVTLVRGAEPEQEETDATASAALAVQTVSAAAAAATARGAKGQAVLVVDGPGVSTTGAIDDARAGVLEADAATKMSFATEQHLAPAAGSLRGVAVVLMGLAGAAGAQEPFPAEVKSGLEEFWVSFYAAGDPDSITVLDAPTSAAEPSGAPRVTPITWSQDVFAAPEAGRSTTVSWPDTVVPFQPDRAEFVDPAAARATAAEPIRFLHDNPSATALFVGHVARVDLDDPRSPGGVALSLARAQAWKQVFVDAGIDASRIQTEGTGSDWPGWVPDHDPVTGELVEEKARLNRTVDATFTNR